MEGVNPQLGNSNPIDNKEIHSYPVDTTMADQPQTSFASIVLGSIDFSIAPSAKNDDYRNVLHKIQEAGACTLCMSPSHHASSCNRKGEQSCEYCKTKNIGGHSTHHAVVCPKKPKREQVKIGVKLRHPFPMNSMIDNQPPCAVQ